MKISKYLLLAATMLVLIIAGCAKEEEAAKHEPIKAVKVSTIVESQAPVSLAYIGNIDAKELVKYSFKMAGQIKQIYVTEGDQVKKGQALAELDTTDLKFQVASAKATIDMAADNIKKAEAALTYNKSLYEKTKALYDSSAVAQDSLEQVQLKRDVAASELAQAQSQYELAKTDYAYKADLLINAVLYAEQEGFVASKLFNANERVGAFMPVLVVRSIDQIVNIGIPQQELASIAIGTKAAVKVDNTTAQGVVTNISAIPDENTRTYPAEIAVSGQTFPLGAIARVSIAIGQQTGVWIPMTAVLSDGENYVYTVKDNHALRRMVEIQKVSDDQVLVSGLNQGEALVVGGMTNLTDSAKVQVEK